MTRRCVGPTVCFRRNQRIGMENRALPSEVAGRGKAGRVVSMVPGEGATGEGAPGEGAFGEELRGREEL